MGCSYEEISLDLVHGLGVMSLLEGIFILLAFSFG